MFSKKAPKNANDSLSRTIGRYASSLVVRQVFGVLNAYLKPLLLTPSLYGLWNLLNTVLLYVDLLHLGVRSAMRYRIPANEARGDEAGNRSIMGSVFYGTLILYLLAIVALGVVACLWDSAPEQRFGLLALATVIALNWFGDFKTDLLKARSRFAPIATANYLTGIVGSILNVVLILLFGFYGLLLALVLTSGLALIYLIAQNEAFTLARFQVVVFINLIRDGFPIIAFDLSTLLMRTIDRLIITLALGLDELGYYSIAVMGLSFLMYIPDASREVIEPRLVRELQTRPLRDCLRDYVDRPLMVTAYVMTLFIGPAMLLMPVAINLLLPDYNRGVLAAQILTGGSLFMAYALVLRGLIVARGVQKGAALIMMGVVLVNGLLSTGMIWLGLGISGVALSSSLSFLTLFIALWIFLRYHVPELPRLNWVFLFGPLVLAIAMTVTSGIVVELREGRSILPAVTGVMLFLLLMIPVYNHNGKQMGYWNAITWSTLTGRESKSK